VGKVGTYTQTHAMAADTKSQICGVLHLGAGGGEIP